VVFAYVDASALVKRYTPEQGSPVIDHLFGRVSLGRMIVLSVGMAEVVSILARKRNRGAITPASYGRALRNFQRDVGTQSPVRIVGADGDLAERSFDFIDSHGVNSTDAILLRSALDIAARLRRRGDDLLLVTSDRRLLRTARAEGLAAFDPEQQSVADLDIILGP
jgi:predicted nucleic acid-binding protein